MKLLSVNPKNMGDSVFMSKIRQLVKKSGKNEAGEPSELSSDPKKKKKTKRIIILAVCAVVVLIGAVIGIKVISSSKNSAGASVTYTTSTVEKRDISVTLSGSGTLEPADSYEVTSLASGEILSADF